MSKKAIIIGAGPAGLTAAYELLKRTDIVPIILEKSGDIGGISKTVNYKGNRIDIGGHRFFSKSDRVMDWWLNIMPVEIAERTPFSINYQNKSRKVDASTLGNAETGTRDSEKVLLLRKRLSRIYFLRKFFSYPIQLSMDTLRKLGLWTTITIMVSYLKAKIFPRRSEKNLEDFMVNRFGNVLYSLFFKDYTEKVWGIPCNLISAEWGAQRIKGVSISRAIRHAVQASMRSNGKKFEADVSQKNTETSLIEQFLYPKLGPGQLWEEVARQIEEMGGMILKCHDVKKIYASGPNRKIIAVSAIDNKSGEISYLEGDYFFSTMPVKELIEGLDESIPEDVKEVASGLQYRDFITVGVLLKRLSFQNKITGEWHPLDLKDTWIYIQERDVKVGRLQIFNNWSPHLVKDPNTVWVGMEFFCNTDDSFWRLSDEEIKQRAIYELQKIGLASEANVLDSTVLRVEKTYPAYFGTYDRFEVIKNYVDRFSNLFLVGRNGMHKYNNSDHSMLTAMVAVDNIKSNITTKENIWAINTEQDYHEEKVPDTVDEEKVRGSHEYSNEKPTHTLINYLFKKSEHKWLIGIGIFGVILQLIVFKFLYPYAGFVNGDSYAYLQTAYHNLEVNTYPIGYSMFLRLLSVFTKSDTILVVLQYLFIHLSIWAFLFSVFYFCNPSKITKVILFGVMLFNPVFLYLANYVSSDALFFSISLTWFTQLLWIIYRPTAGVLLTNAIVLFIAFTIRYNALYYPFITVVALLLSRKQIVVKGIALVLTILLIGSFINYTSNKYFSLTKQRQFSPFTGWQIANNALYAYRYISNKEHKPVPKRFRDLDMVVRSYFDSTRDVRKHPQEMLLANTVYMWDHRSPLQIFMNRKFGTDSTVASIKRWASVAPLYKEYGAFLIRAYPNKFLRFYLYPNALKYYAPPVEFLSTYSTGVDSVQSIAKIWFNYKSNKLKTYFSDFNVNTLNFYPILSGVLNVVFIFGVICIFILGGERKQHIATKTLIVVIVLWVLNFGFSVFASPIALRFQLFPIIVFCVFDFLLIEYLVMEARRKNFDSLKPNGGILAEELENTRYKVQEGF